MFKTVFLSALILVAQPASASYSAPSVRSGPPSGVPIQAPRKPDSAAGGEVQPATWPEDQEELSPAEVSAANLKRAEAAADRFMDRLAETIDLRTALEEAMPDSEARRQMIIRTWDNFTPDKQDGTSKDADDDGRMEAYYAVHNLYLASIFYGLSKADLSGGESAEQVGSELNSLPEAAELNQVMERLSSEGSTTTPANLKEAVSVMNRYSARVREEIERTGLDSERYRSNLAVIKKTETDHPGRILKGLPEMMIGEDVEVYEVERVAFRFLFIVKDGEMTLIGLHLNMGC